MSSNQNYSFFSSHPIKDQDSSSQISSRCKTAEGHNTLFPGCSSWATLVKNAGESAVNSVHGTEEEKGKECSI